MTTRDRYGRTTLLTATPADSSQRAKCIATCGTCTRLRMISRDLSSAIYSKPAAVGVRSRAISAGVNKVVAFPLLGRCWVVGSSTKLAPSWVAALAGRVATRGASPQGFGLIGLF